MVMGAEGVAPWGSGRVVEGATEAGVGALCWLDPWVVAETPGELWEREADAGEDVDSSLCRELPAELLAEEFPLWKPACDPVEAERFLEEPEPDDPDPPEEEPFLLEEDFLMEEGAGDFLGLLELEEL